MFKEGEWAAARDAYSAALQAQPEGPEAAALYSNRAAALLKLGDAAAALGDAEVGRAVGGFAAWAAGGQRWPCFTARFSGVARGWLG